MTKTVTILGETVVIDYCLAVEIAYEEISGVPFDGQDIVKRKTMIVLALAAIVTANPDTAITLDRLMKEATADEILALTNAVMESSMAWYKIPSVMEEQPQASDEDAGSKKN